jgi:hypothetical protein
MKKSRSIYVVQSGPGPVKVGIAGRVAQRLSQLRVSSPVPLHLFFCAETDDDVASLEKRTHRILRDSHMSGEWFNVTAQEAAHAVVQAAGDLGFLLREPMPEQNRKSRGRPRVDAVLVGVRIPPDMLAALDKFVERQIGIGRPEAIRLILKDWLSANGMLGGEAIERELRRRERKSEPPPKP